jgi:hypothetical protein
LYLTVVIKAIRGVPSRDFMRVRRWPQDRQAFDHIPFPHHTPSGPRACHDKVVRLAARRDLECHVRRESLPKRLTGTQWHTDQPADVEQSGIGHALSDIGTPYSHCTLRR